MAVEGVANFVRTPTAALEINGTTYPGGALRGFHESLGKRYQAYMTDEGLRSDGWPDAGHLHLRDRLTPRSTDLDRNYTYTELYKTDPIKQAAWELSVARQLPEHGEPPDRRRHRVLREFAITPPEARASPFHQGELSSSQAAVQRASCPGRGRGAGGGGALPSGVEKAEALKSRPVDVLVVRASWSSTPSTTG